MRYFAVIAVALVCVPSCLAGGFTINATTTLSAQTSNNTSAANSFGPQSDGNLGASNISKVDTHSLLYPGADTKIYAHLELWWGVPGHIDIGYSSVDPSHVKQQVEDMISRGINGIVMVWYGPNNPIDQAAQLVMKEAELHPGFTFALMVDHGAILWDSCNGCSPQNALIAQLQYVEQTFFSSPAYLKINGQPVITDFDIDLFYQIDWSAVKSALSTSPAFMFQNNDGFSHAVSDGAYSWVMPTTTDYGASYLASFYATGAQFPSEQSWGASYKGFNDSLASWTLHRTMGQQCGQTWLQTFSEINKVYSAKNPLPAMQLVTWNDYEEGTEIESGIDNCVSLSAEVSGNSLQWKVSGQENTIDHYTVYVSEDGQNLMKLTDLATGSNSLDLCSYALPAGNYDLYVQAIGKPSVKNQMSTAVSYAANCPVTTPPAPAPAPAPTPTPAPTPGATVTLTATPSSVTLTAGQAATSSIVVAPSSGSFDQAVSLSCSNLPPGLTCGFSPSVVTPGSGGVTSVLTFSAGAAFASLNPAVSKRGNVPFRPYMLTCALMGFALMGGIDKKRALKMLTLGSLICAMLLCSSCGGGGSSSTTAQPPSPSSFTVTITGASGTAQASTTVHITTP
jgi:hypothetical protein